MDLDVIGLRVFPLSLTGEAAIWFTELPYNSIFTWNQLRDVFLARYYLISKKLNHNDRVNNFVESVPNHCIDDESLKEYSYRGPDDNNKAVFDTIADGSYGECPYGEIAEKLEKISRNNKAGSTRKSDKGRNTFAVQSTHNPATDEIREEMAQMRTELRLVLKHVKGTKVKGNKVRTMVTTTVRVIMSEMETTTATTTLTGVTMLTETTGMGPMSLHKIMKLLLGMVEIVWRELRICCTK